MYLVACTNNECGLHRCEQTETQNINVSIVSTVLKVVESTTVAFGVGWTIYQNVFYGLDGKLIAGLLCGSCIWGIGKYNQSVLNQKVTNLEQLLYERTFVPFKSVKVQEETTLYRSDSESSIVSSGDVDSPLPMSTDESDW